MKNIIFIILFCVAGTLMSQTLEKKFSKHPLTEIITSFGNPEQILMYHYNTKTLLIYKSKYFHDSTSWVWNLVEIDAIRNSYTIDNINIDLVVHKEIFLFDRDTYDSLFFHSKEQILKMHYLAYHYFSSSPSSIIGYKNYDYIDFVACPLTFVGIYHSKDKYGCVADIVSLSFMNIVQALEDVEIKTIYNTDNSLYMYDWPNTHY